MPSPIDWESNARHIGDMTLISLKYIDGTTFLSLDAVASGNMVCRYGPVLGASMQCLVGCVPDTRHTKLSTSVNSCSHHFISSPSHCSLWRLFNFKKVHGKFIDPFQAPHRWPWQASPHCSLITPRLPGTNQLPQTAPLPNADANPPHVLSSRIRHPGTPQHWMNARSPESHRRQASCPIIPTISHGRASFGGPGPPINRR